MKCIDIQVLLFVVSLAKSFAMSIDELQDFSNFLKETSLLDQPLKKNPSDEDDDDVPISDHAWEESGRFEGDLVLNDRQRQLIVQDIAEGLSRNGLKDSTKRWPNNEVIFYIQKEHFTGDQIQAILRGIEDLGQASCVKFRPYRKGDRDAVVVQGSRRGCFSQVGYQGGYQVLNLSGRHPVGRGCFRHGTVVHEFLHTLGFYHMQSSPDRDDYIDVIWENIVQPARHNFRKYNLFSVSDFGVGYDYDSVLHYSRKAFSSNGGDTLVPKKNGADIGQRVGLSDKDSAKLNKMYCDADSNNFEAVDDEPHAPVTKKKKTPKNKPFEGHGIGYHQGKTVVFKLPAAETYRLPETPSNHMFDYFSKAPQAMSPTLIEGFGVGKKISYSYNLPAGYQIVEHNIPIYTALFNKTNRGVEPITRHDITTNKNDGTKPLNIESANQSKETIEDFDEKSINVEKSKNTQSTDRNFHADVYKPNTDYSEFHNPVNNYKVGTKTDYYLNYLPVFKGKNDQATTTKMTNLKLTKQFIEKLREPKPSDLLPNNKEKSRPFLHDEFDHERETTEKSKAIAIEKSNLGEVDLSFRNTYPHKKLEEIKSIYSLKPEYFSKIYLENRHDFSNIYKPNENLNTDRPNMMENAQYTIFGDPVPLSVDYVPKNSESVEILDSHSLNKDVNEKIKEHDRNIEENYSYEDFEPHESTEKNNKPQATHYDERDTKHSYEVTEKNVDQIATVTEKTNLEHSELQHSEHSLEKRLPAILERYVNYDNYDITSPYLSSKLDENRYYSKNL